MTRVIDTIVAALESARDAAAQAAGSTPVPVTPVRATAESDSGTLSSAVQGMAAVAAAVNVAASGAPKAQMQPSAAPPQTRDEVESRLAALAKTRGSKLNWKTSIVDLMKLLELDSSLAARRKLAEELGYQGQLDGSAEMNLWLHERVMRRLSTDEAAVTR